MLKILIIHGSPRKGETYKMTMEFLKELGNRMEIEVNDIFLFKERLELCRGCGTCVLYGENKCSLNDGFKEIHAFIRDSDAVIITTPVYSLHVSALLKNFIDRSAYIMHRPCYFGKYFMSISTQAFSGDKDVAKYLANVMHFWGFNIIPGLRFSMTSEDQTTAQKNKIWKKINVAVNQFVAIEKKARFPVPAWKDLMMFRVRRTVMNSKSYKDIFPRDVEYFQENNWLNTTYYYDIHLNPLMRITGRFFDALGKKMIKNESQQEA